MTAIHAWSTRVVVTVPHSVSRLGGHKALLPPLPPPLPMPTMNTGEGLLLPIAVTSDRVILALIPTSPDARSVELEIVEPIEEHVPNEDEGKCHS